MVELRRVVKEEDIPGNLKSTPVGELLRYNNLGSPFRKHETAELLIAMCMDNRKHLRIPENFAYIIRTGGANLRYSEFKVSYAVAIGGVTHVVLIGHTNCGMVNLMSRREQFIQGLVEKAGWDEKRAEEHFMNYAPMFEIDNAIDFVVSEANRLNEKYPKIAVSPLMYKVEDNMLYLIE